ncbi:MAG TPA: diguanylate cyclase [Gemmatimonadaceae bacterium]|nr:diguanylate cyclase [Gemmatimonadaceae bacterium]
MNGLSPNLYLAALGPLTELLGVIVVVGVFALLRSQADRRPYFKAWEASFAFFAVSLTAGLFYERFVDPSSVFYPVAPTTTKLAALVFLMFRLLGMAMVVKGAQLYARGTVAGWLTKVAIPVAIVLAVVADTSKTPLAPLRLLHGPFGALTMAYAAWLFAGLPRSRQSAGTRTAALSFVLLALLSAGLAVFYGVQRVAPDLTTNPWLIRFARYGFYTDLLLRLLLAWAMVRLLIEDGRREADDTRAHLRLVQDRERLGELYDQDARVLTRRAFDALVGLDFARASFGTVGRLRIANYQRVANERGPAVANALLAHLAGVLDSALRAHDRVYRWSADELLIVMPRAVPSVARARIEFLAARAAPLTVGGSQVPVRAEPAVAIRYYHGGEELPTAAAAAAQEGAGAVLEPVAATR